LTSICNVYLLPYSPDLERAEALWINIDKPVIKRHCDTLDLGAAVLNCSPGNGMIRLVLGRGSKEILKNLKLRDDSGCWLGRSTRARSRPREGR